MLEPSDNDYVKPDRMEPAKFIVVVDTEEEFDWSAGVSRENTSVQGMNSIGRLQTVFDEYRIKPVYVVDYPVASQPDGYRPLQEIHQDGRCVIGSHLHPWVTPPYSEAVSSRNSFPGNLEKELESRKLQLLGELIGERFGAAPTVYKAGRYGVGCNTAAILEEQGYEVDLSVCPHMDYSAEGGPDFRRLTAQPYWFGVENRLLELPLTVGFTGPLRRWGAAIHRTLLHNGGFPYTGLGTLGRLGLLNKAWLSPEGHQTFELLQLIRTLWRDGQRIFSFTLHSPSAAPGNTPYVRSDEELTEFLSRCRTVFDLLVGELQAIPTTPMDVKRELSERATQRSPKVK